MTSAVRKRVAILISGRGSNMSALIEAAKASDYPAEIVGVFSNIPDAPGLAAAAAEGIPTAARPHKSYAGKAEFEAALQTVLDDWRAELVCLAGFMRLLSPEFCARWDGRLLNIHPSLLPAHKGLDTHARALAEGDIEHGCTVHVVTAGMDDGPIVAQARVVVRPGETAESLAARVLVEEHKLYPQALALVARRPSHTSSAEPEPLTLRRLAEADAAIFRDIRLEGLRFSPTAFGSSYEAEHERPVNEFAKTLAASYVAGAFLGNRLVGVAGLQPGTRAKDAHRGNLWGVYVRPEARGRSVARAVVENVLAYARGHLGQVHLCVVTENAPAIALYQHLGFTTYGTEPRSLCVDGRYLDEYLMVLRLDA